MKTGDKLRIEMEARLRSGEWTAGQRLPTERALGERHGVSRSTVRRVLATLKSQHLIRQVVGRGTYVSDDLLTHLPDERVAASAGTTGPAELMEARLVLEPMLLEMVVVNATAVHFARMDLCCARGEEATTVDAFEHWDARLHEAIAEAARNTFVANVLRFMNQVRQDGEWGALKRRSLTDAHRVRYAREHRAIVAALRQRDVTAAREAMLAHLRHVRVNLLGY